MAFVTPRRDGPPPREYRGLPFAAAGVGDWFEERLADAPWLFGIIPMGFEAYARVFHPAYHVVGGVESPTMFAPRSLTVSATGEQQTAYMREVRWAEVAEANDRVAHPTMEWAAITGAWAYRDGRLEQPGLWEVGPTHGSLDQQITIRMCELLAGFTSTPAECCFGISMIYGDLPDRVRKEAPQVADSHVVTGPLNVLADTSFAAHHHRSPNVWWPADRAWCVVSNIDLEVTHVAGSQRCIDRLVRDERLEALQIDPSRPTTDEINPDPEGSYNG